LSYSQDLKHHYQLYQLLLFHFQNKEPEKFFELIEDNLKQVHPIFQTVFKTFLKDKEKVINALQLHYSNAKLEATNNLIKLIKRNLFYKDYASLFRNNKELVKSLSPSNSIVASWSWYSHQRLANLPLVRIGEDAHRNPLMQNEKRKNLTILIVGETSRAENFSLNGYP
ncbi:transposase, partial [Streptococcus pneumoniae]|uniref:transposase n=1 Tax=Streptococcus pneumoniae TaxID=1313 RepID=UPI0028647C9E